MYIIGIQGHKVKSANHPATAASAGLSASASQPGFYLLGLSGQTAVFKVMENPVASNARWNACSMVGRFSGVL